MGAAAISARPPGVDGNRRARPWVVVVVVVLAVGGALVGGGVSGIGDGASTPVDDDVALPTEDAGDPADGSGGDDERRSDMACAPPGCQVWRVDEPVGRGVEVSDALVLHLGDDEMVAYDAADGRELWRQPTPGSVSRNPAMTTLSEHGLALVHGGAGGLTPNAEPNASPPMPVSVHDVADGGHRVDLELDAEILLGTTWVGARLVVRTAGSGGPRGAGRTSAYSPGGQLLWDHDAEGPVRLLPDGTLLELGDDQVRRISVDDGSVAWEVAGELAGVPRREEEMLVFDRAAGRIQVVDPADGTIRTTVPADGARGATGLGPWVLVTHDEEIRVHARSSGELLFTRERRAQERDGGPMRMATATRVGNRVVVAWGDRASAGGDELELEVRTLDGALDRTLTVPEWRGGPGPVGLHDVGPRRDVLRVTSRGPAGSAAAVHVHSGQVLRRRSAGLVAQQDDLLVLRREHGLTILGPNGEVQVRHVTDVASLDPLVVHGVGGIMRLDRSLVADPE